MCSRQNVLKVNLRFLVFEGKQMLSTFVKSMALNNIEGMSPITASHTADNPTPAVSQLTEILLPW